MSDEGGSRMTDAPLTERTWFTYTVTSDSIYLTKQQIIGDLIKHKEHLGRFNKDQAALAEELCAYLNGALEDQAMDDAYATVEEEVHARDTQIESLQKQLTHALDALADAHSQLLDGPFPSHVHATAFDPDDARYGEFSHRHASGTTPHGHATRWAGVLDD